MYTIQVQTRLFKFCTIFTLSVTWFMINLKHDSSIDILWRMLKQAANASRFWPSGRGIYHNENKTFLVWCNEEDHLRLISMQMGGNLGEVSIVLLTQSYVRHRLSSTQRPNLTRFPSCHERQHFSATELFRYGRHSYMAASLHSVGSWLFVYWVLSLGLWV